MNKTKSFDIIVVGAGSGGLNIASFMNRSGFSVLLIDKNDAHIGGDCLNFGCIPSKALIHVARTIANAKEAESFGLTVSGKVLWEKVRAYIKEKQDIIRCHENAEWFREKGMTVVLGGASFVSNDTIKVGDQTFTGKKIVLATGSRPRILTGHGIEKVKRVLNNENIFTMDTLPERLLVIGAGPIGVEIAQALATLGSRVTVIDLGTQILGKEDVEIAGVAQCQLEKEGILFKLGYTLKEFTDATTAVIEGEHGEESLSFDGVFVGIGRVINTDGLSLEKAGIAVDSAGRLVVDSYLRTTNKKVYACGDVAGNYQFTHAAEMHAGVILHNFFSPFKNKFSADHISWTTFTTPEVATYGLQENELKNRRIKYRVLQTDFSHDDRAITDNYQYGIAKMFIDEKDVIRGGTMVAPHAGELIAELVLGQRHGLTVGALFNKTYAYPTATRINKHLVSNYMKERLSPGVKRILKLLFAFNQIV